MAELDGLDAEAVAGWLVSDAGFVARLNRTKSYRAERLRADVLSPASDAVATLRERSRSRDAGLNSEKQSLPR